jgi:hypothetical protein
MRRGLPALLSSGYAQPAVKDARDGRSVPIIAKPYRIADLAAAVRKCSAPPGRVAADAAGWPHPGSLCALSS